VNNEVISLLNGAVNTQAPVVVVGAGPVGVRFAQELHRKKPNQPMVIYGKESWTPYNRVLLSSFFAGETEWAAMTAGLSLPQAKHIDVRLGCMVTDINPHKKTVTDSTGLEQPYADLVLAVGSQARVPDIPGVGQAGVYVFRDMDDVQALFARRSRSRKTLVVGGGLLGLEAARAMQKMNTEVTVLEHNSRLMKNQLDVRASELLQAHVEQAGIQVVLNSRLKRIHGEGRVEGASLDDDQLLECDTIILAAGVKPQIALAETAELSVAYGVCVDDAMRTSDPHIYAVGECAEHREKVYAMVAPGLEQASVAVHSMTEGVGSGYNGSLLAAQLKVLDIPVFSAGRVSDRDGISVAKQVIYEDAAAGIYRKIVIERERVIGFVAVGENPEAARIQEALLHKRFVMPWQLWAFKNTGLLWKQGESDRVAGWPATTVVCNCNSITRGELSIAIAEGCSTVDKLACQTRASTVCGSCKPLLAELVGSDVKPEPVIGGKPMLVGVVIATLLTLAAILAPSFPYATTVQLDWHWDVLWRDGFNKQVSGFVVLGMTALGLLVSLRKRWKKINIGDYAIWRLAHVLLGALAVIALYGHTGGRLGSNLNFMLMAFFCGLILVGGFSAAIIAQAHRLSPKFAKQWREKGIWIHILLFWPVPLLLAFHILKSYYY